MTDALINTGTTVIHSETKEVLFKGTEAECKQWWRNNNYWLEMFKYHGDKPLSASFGVLLRSRKS